MTEGQGTLFSQEIREQVLKLGHPVHMHTPLCAAWKEEHENCEGCESELGCGMQVRLMGICLLPQLYHPSSFEDFQRMQRRIQELQELTLEAKTAAELRELPMV